jgi:hypothetical protein
MKIEEIAEYMRKNIEKNCTVEGTANLNLVKNLREKQDFRQVVFFHF